MWILLKIPTFWKSGFLRENSMVSTRMWFDDNFKHFKNSQFLLWKSGFLAWKFKVLMIKIVKKFEFFSLGRTHLIFSNFLCILHLVKTRCQKGHYLDTGAKIHILSKNSNLQVLIFDKIPHFKNLIFHMIHITKISYLTKFNPIIHEIHIFQGSDFGILKQKMHIFMEFEKLRFWSFRIWDFGKMWGFVAKNKWGF